MSEKKYLLTALSTVAAASFSLTSLAGMDSSSDPFQAQDLPAGFQVSADDHEGSCGEGNCGEDKDKDKDSEGSCGEGNCGEGNCGEGNCGEEGDHHHDEEHDDEKGEEGSCGSR